ncbi:spermidine/putrescine ABC transporter ATP-binding protein [Bacillus mycoides]|nr:spermidine/putrescine ABC transporter ATP-binding protein [Bacillus mycoides]
MLLYQEDFLFFPALTGSKTPTKKSNWSLTAHKSPIGEANN